MLTTYGGGTTGSQRSAIVEVENAARNRLNTMLRDRNQPTYQSHEEIPKLYVLTEALHHTAEPLRTHALRALEHDLVPFCVSIPINVLFGQTLTIFNPWDDSPKPVPRVIKAIQQIASWKYKITPEMDNMGVLSSVALDENEKPKISHRRFCPPPEHLPEKLDRLAGSYKVTPDPRATGSVVSIAWNPEEDEAAIVVSKEERANHGKQDPAFQGVYSGSNGADPNYAPSIKGAVANAAKAVGDSVVNEPPPPAMPKEPKSMGR